MKQTRPQFTHANLLDEVRKSITQELQRSGMEDKKNSHFSNLDCLMSGLVVFTFKFPSLLKFDRMREQKDWVKANLKQLFKLKETPCDTHIRTRLDVIVPDVLRKCYRRIFTLLQRGKVLEHYKFLGKYYLVSADGTGVFSSDAIHCEHCCEKVHNRGKDTEYTTYHHQIFAAVTAHKY